MKTIILLTVVLALAGLSQALKPDECEVCRKFLEKFLDGMDKEKRSTPKDIEEEFKKVCLKARGKEQRFCYYLGGLEESATGILGEMSKPASFFMPTEKICEKLKKLDQQICDLRYDKEIDLNNVDLKKLKVRDLKKILNDWDESCLDCIEKSDFIKRIEELKPSYVKSEL